MAKRVGSEGRPHDSGGRLDDAPGGRYAIALVINLSAKALETGQYGTVQEVTRW